MPPPPRPMSTPPQSPRNSSPRETTVVVCINVLPLVFSRASLTESCPWHVEWSTSSYGLFLRNIVSKQGYKPMFIGCPEVYIPKSDEQSVRMLLLHSFNCIPVFLDTTVAHRHFQGFCKGVLWPIFHNVVDVYNSAELKLDDFTEMSPSTPVQVQPAPPDPGVWLPPASWNPASQDKCWSEYCHVNRLFAKKVIENWQPGSVIWIHDYPLLVLASYLLRKLRGGGALALFMHVPFPSSEIFRTLTVRTELLRAMLCANHIGFLVFEHARHFLTACKRLLGLDYRTSHTGMLAVEYNGRLVLITCSHCGTELNHMRDLLGKLDSDARAVALQSSFAPLLTEGDPRRKKYILASVDRLEGLCGVPLKLRAFDRFLSMYPMRRKDTVLVQFGISLDCRPNDYHRTQQYVEKFVAEINRRWGAPSNPVVIYEERVHMQAQERMVLWRLGHVFLDTCVRGGLSMLPFEFLAAHHQHPDDDPGVVVVSEFACYSRILNGALLVNPWKADDVVAALVKAVEMPPYEMHSRFALNFKFLLDNPVSDWGGRMLADIEKAGMPALPSSPNADGTGDMVEVGFGFDYRVVQFSPGFAALCVDDTVRAYAIASRRLLVFDYGGTLSWTQCVMDDGAPMYLYHDGPAGRAVVDPEARLASVRKRDGQVRTPVSIETKASLELLCHDPCNVVVVWSNGRRVELEHEFGSIAGLHLISDSGYFLRKADSLAWESLYADSADDFAWKHQVTNVVKTYVSRTNGSFVIENDTSVTFDYHSSDPEYGEMQAAELYEQLSHVLKKDKVAIARGKGFVEVHRFGVNKAIAISMVLSFCKDKVDLVPDFILCIGDDESDEPAFKTIRAFAEAEKLPHVLTCTVGKKPSTAQCYVDSVSEVLSLIDALSVVRTKRLARRNSSPTSAARHQETVAEQMQQSFQRRFLNAGKIISPVFVRNLSKEFSKVISTTNLEEFCVDRFNPAMLTSPRGAGRTVDDDATELEAAPPAYWLDRTFTAAQVLQAAAIGGALGWGLRHHLRRFFAA
ncbi:trehalose-phosphatase, variant 1 [Aphanomyces invadans]|uniref:Trehalose-phosphatase, variant 1 n=1 Tax=Aphanomyces invadans TaxID=157072 RepID=A0A024TCV8_9STRA|nr:trehalose-phosphatase, variant 1 [Aphanomyces invadans]ETV91849.1 trehalose-phosphatase, variant 1 [Aphanomyces invadans]|eukprot:XP_008879487.1 trehalose-phosphatase, variant 1 [Aphanomyces invadans]